MKANRGGEILAKAPAVWRSIVIDHAHLIVSKAVDAVFIQKKLRVLDQEVPYLRLRVVEHQPAGMTFVQIGDTASPLVVRYRPPLPSAV